MRMFREFVTTAVTTAVTAAVAPIREQITALDTRLTEQITALDTRLTEQITAVDNRVTALAAGVNMSLAQVRQERARAQNQNVVDAAASLIPLPNDQNVMPLVAGVVVCRLNFHTSSRHAFFLSSPDVR